MLTLTMNDILTGALAIGAVGRLIYLRFKPKGD